MSAITTRFDGIDCHISRSGYTGEDGFEISCKATRVRAIVERLLSEPSVKLIGLGARDSLRLEAGLCLYGHDIDTTTSPVEAALTWSIQKRRRDGGRLSRRRAHPARAARGPARVRVGIKPEGRAPAREGTEIRSRRRASRSARSRPAASGRPSTGRSRWATSKTASPSPARGAAHRARQGACRRASSRCRSCRTDTFVSAQERKT